MRQLLKASAQEIATPVAVDDLPAHLEIPGLKRTDATTLMRRGAIENPSAKASAVNGADNISLPDFKNRLRSPVINNSSLDYVCSSETPSQRNPAARSIWPEFPANRLRGHVVLRVGKNPAGQRAGHKMRTGRYVARAAPVIARAALAAAPTAAQTLARGLNLPARWLIDCEAVRPGHVKAAGVGSHRPALPNTGPDRLDNPDGRRRNRRVEITIAK